MPPRILVSAGEASGDLYAGLLVAALRRRFPNAEFFGCPGRCMRLAGVEPVINAEDLSVVGLFEVLRHIPRIYGRYRHLIQSARERAPHAAILTDSPDFHLRLARHLHRLHIPTIYLVAPQVWAWRQGRIRQMRQYLDRLLCIFPFEEEYFRARGLAADYIGHPLTRIVKPILTRAEFFALHGLAADRPLLALLPGSRAGEIGRHLDPLLEAGERLARSHGCQSILALPAGIPQRIGDLLTRRRIDPASIHIVEGETWDCLAHSDIALAASGTVTIEAALLGTPMVTFYRVTSASWLAGRLLLKVPFYSMVNLIAGRAIVPELMQDDLTGAGLAEAAARLLSDAGARAQMKQELAHVAARLHSHEDPVERAAGIVSAFLVPPVANGETLTEQRGK